MMGTTFAHAKQKLPAKGNTDTRFLKKVLGFEQKLFLFIADLEKSTSYIFLHTCMLNKFQREHFSMNFTYISRSKYEIGI